MQENTILLGVNLIILLTVMILFLQVAKAKKQNQIATRIAGLESDISKLERSWAEGEAKNRAEASANARTLREDLTNTLTRFKDFLFSRLHENGNSQLGQLDSLTKQLQVLKTVNEQAANKLREDVNTMLNYRLEQVQMGLGEMQALAAGVDNLKRELSNFKMRDTWNDLYLTNLLERILPPEQYSKNVVTKPGSNERVEFAVKLPRRDSLGSTLWLPIETKYPQEDRLCLLDALETANSDLADEAGRALENWIKAEANGIAEKYICVPYTTEFAILFLSTEGLCAEVLRHPGLCDFLLREYKVVIAGPTTLSAILHSVLMCLRTPDIERRDLNISVRQSRKMNLLEP